MKKKKNDLRLELQRDYSRLSIEDKGLRIVGKILGVINKEDDSVKASINEKREQIRQEKEKNKFASILVSDLQNDFQEDSDRALRLARELLSDDITDKLSRKTRITLAKKLALYRLNQDADQSTNYYKELMDYVVELLKRESVSRIARDNEVISTEVGCSLVFAHPRKKTQIMMKELLLSKDK